jgi:hypothetical protein
MPGKLDSLAPVSVEQFHDLLNEAGLAVSAERAPMVLEELNAQLAFARTFPDTAKSVNGDNEDWFDPAFPNIDAKDEAE